MELLRAGWTWRSAAVAQGVLAVVALLALAFVPPAHGRTLLVPFSGEPISRSLLDRLMLTPMRPGPLRGSLLVEGKGRELAGTMLNQGILMLAAPAVICGPGEIGSDA